jgi:hypothetical protein
MHAILLLAVWGSEVGAETHLAAVLGAIHWTLAVTAILFAVRALRA